MKRISWTFLAVITTMVIALVLAACAPAPTPTPTKAPPAPTKAPEAPKAATPAAAPKATTPAASPATPKAEAPAKPKELAVVKVGLVGYGSDGGAFIADARGYFKEQSIQFEFVPFNAPPPMVSALATNQVDVAGVGPNPQFLNAVSRDINIKTVADKGNLSKGNGFLALVVRKNLVDSGKYKGAADLKGLKIAIAPPAMTSPSAINVDIMLQGVGLTLKDVELVDLANPEVPAALAGGSIDAAAAGEPLISQAVEKAVGVRVIGFDEVSPNMQISGISYSPAFMKDRPDVAKRFMVAYVKGLRDYNDAFVKNKGKADVIKILTQATSTKDPAVWEKMVPTGLNPDGYINLDSYAYQIDWYFKNGQIKEKRDAKDLVDNQYVDYAIGVLGKYN